MFSKKGMMQVATIFLLISFVTGCVKQRPEILNQADQNTFSIRWTAPAGQQANAQNKWNALSDNDSYIRSTEHTISTGPVLFKQQNSIAEELINEPDSGFRFLDVVNFESTHPLLNGKAPIAYMLGEPNKTYPVIEELTPTHLILYKVVSDEELSFSEKTIALPYNGKWRVPVGGYSIQYCKQQRTRNEDNRETNLIVCFPVPAQDYRTATHFNVDPNNFVPFDRFVKSDVLPKDFFDGEWYFTETTVEARYEGGGRVGDLGGSDSNFLTATRIKFRIFDDQIVGLNTNVDEEFKDDPNSLNYNTVIKIKVEHRDFKWVRMGADTLKELEEEVKDKTEKRFIKLFYLESETPQTTVDELLASIFGRINNFRNVLDVTYGKNYFSYSVRDAQSGTIKRYSMRKIDTARQLAPRQAFKDDNLLFGAFTTQKYKKLDYKVYRQSDVERLIIMARHNPNKDIVYHFTTNTPKDKWFRDIGRASIDLWDQAFRKAGLKIRIRLDESKDVALGDIRYNVLNIVDRAGAGLLGFGPSLIDSETGEIVSASMNTGVDNILEQFYRVVRNYLGRRSGTFYDFRVDNPSQQLQASADMPYIFKLISQINDGLYIMDSRTGEVRVNGLSTLNPALLTDEEKKFLREFDIALDAPMKTLVEKIYDLRAHSYRYSQMGGPFDWQTLGLGEQTFSSTAVLDEAIDNNCSEVVALANRLQQTPYIDTIEEISIIEPCVKLLAQGEAVLTTVHELGHNLSLRHNFRGSVDKDNFPDLNDYQVRHVTLASGVQRQMTSSIMEYVTQEGQQVMPGLYDLAAIRWIYNGEVEKKNGEIVKIDTTKRIADNINLAELKSYQFCTDEQRIFVTDPLCNYFDKGTTVKETVAFQIDQFYNTLSSLYRYDRRSTGDPVYTLLIREGPSLKAKYDQWRAFLRKHTGVNKGYLQGYTVRSYKQLIDSIRARGGQDAVELEKHLEVRNMIATFLLDLAFMSNKYCVVKDSTGLEKLLELETIRKELFGVGDFSVIETCQSPSALSYIESKGYRYEKEFGYFLDPGRFDQDPNRILEPLDFAGTSSVRLFAMAFLTGRFLPVPVNEYVGQFSSINSSIEGYSPSMLDEPDIRDLVQFMIVDRIVSGVRAAPNKTRQDYMNISTRLFEESDRNKILENPAYVNFNNEAQLVQSYLNMMAQNLWMPGAIQDDGRREYVSVYRGDPSQMEGIQRIAQDAVESLGVVYYVRDRNTLGGKIMASLRELNSFKELSQFSPQEILNVQVSAIGEILSQNVLFVPLTNYKLRDVAKVALAVTSRAQELLRESPQNNLKANLMNQLVEPEVAIFFTFVMPVAESLNVSLESLIDSIVNGNGSVELPSELVALLDQPANAQYERLKQAGLEAGLPTRQEINQRFAKYASTQSEVYTNYTRNAEEYFAQDNLLRTALQILAR